MILNPIINNKLIKLGAYHLYAEIKFNNWLDYKIEKGWYGFTLFFNYHTSKDLLCFTVRKDNSLVLKEKYKGKYRLIYSEKYDGLKKNNLYTLDLKYYDNQILININGTIIKYNKHINMTNGTCGLRVDYSNIYLKKFEVNYLHEDDYEELTDHSTDDESCSSENEISNTSSDEDENTTKSHFHLNK